MNDQRVKTDNEAIAEFHDGTTFDESGFCTDPERKYSWRPGCYDPLRVEHLRYDKSWDWLMPAIQIAKERIKEAGWGTPTEKEAWSRLNACLNEVYNINIKNAHYCLVKFIEWYQKQKSS